MPGAVFHRLPVWDRTSNRWEINNGIHGIMRIDGLIAACDPYEEPAALTVKGLDGIVYEFHEGIFVFAHVLTSVPLQSAAQRR